MSTIRVRLFGKLSILRENLDLNSLEARKVQELFCYLLLFRDRPHTREALASLLWGENTTSKSKKYLRQALWQLQSALDDNGTHNGSSSLLVDTQWIQINAETDYWLDVAAFESAYASVNGTPGNCLDPECGQTLRDAVDLYRGDLLEGWYQDWCLFERERLQNNYISMLDKLVGFCEAHQEFENGLDFATRILRLDNARERTHRRVMRLYYLRGDRTSALRQFERCVKALNSELGVSASQRTIQLYHQIKNDHLEPEIPLVNSPNGSGTSTDDQLHDILTGLNRISVSLTDLQSQVSEKIRHIKSILDD